MSEPKFKVGMKVLLHEDRRAPQEVEITRVGRTLVYIQQYGPEVAFYADTGIQRHHSCGHPDYILTFEEAAERDRRIAAIARLREHGIAPKGFGDFPQDTATLEALLAVLEQRTATTSPGRRRE